MPVQDWSATADENTAIDGINIAEHCPAKNINNAIRSVMAALKNKCDALDSTDNTLRLGAVIGEVRWFAMSTPPEGWLVCNGAAVLISDYPFLYNAIGNTFLPEGVSASPATFNLPNLVDKFVEGSATAGTVKSAGLPNIKGFISFRTVAHTDNNLILGEGEIFPPTGPFYKTTKSWSGDHSALTESPYSPYAIEQLNMDASRSSSIYGNSTTVQPPALCLLPCIRYE